jgi:hypothetical protein
MINFELYYERRERNPLRKREIEAQGLGTNYDYVEREKENLSKERKSQIRKMEKLGVEPERIEIFKQAKIAEREKELKGEYFRTKIISSELLFQKFGIKVLKDKYATEDFSTGSYRLKMLNFIVTKLVRHFKDVLPNRKPTIVVTDTKKNPLTKEVSVTGDKEFPPGVYYDRLIYIDQNYVDDYDVLVHEYAHFVADRISKQTEPMLKAEYKKMLDEYFKRTTKRKALEGSRNTNNRILMAKQLGLPSDYATANFDEWFAEIITYWKSFPNSKESYRFKTAVKKVLTRI